MTICASRLSSSRQISSVKKEEAIGIEYDRSQVDQKKPAYRMDEENRKMVSSELTRRGSLWSKHASWQLPKAPRAVPRKFSDADTYAQGLHHIKAILDKYNIDMVTGFLPPQGPLQRLSYARYHVWEDLGDDLPKLLGARLGQARGPLRRLPVLSTDRLITDAELRRAHLLLCLFAHAYVFGGNEPRDVLPEGIAKPLWEVSEKLGIPPVLGHPSIVLYNWRKLDVDADICMENLSTLNNFFDGRDESWFYLITVEVEAKGAPAIVPMMLAIDAIQRYNEERNNSADVDTSRLSNDCGGSSNLSNVISDRHFIKRHESFDETLDGYYNTGTFSHREGTSSGNAAAGGRRTTTTAMSSDESLQQKTDLTNSRGKGSGNGPIDMSTIQPYGYEALLGALTRCRVSFYVAAQLREIASAIAAMVQSINSMREGCHPFIFYHRVRPFLSGWKHNPTLPDGIMYTGASAERQQFYGGSAAQSALIPVLDIGLGVKHDSEKSKEFLLAMRDYMLKPHRDYLVYLEQVACIRPFVQQMMKDFNVRQEGQEDGTTHTGEGALPAEYGKDKADRTSRSRPPADSSTSTGSSGPAQSTAGGEGEIEVTKDVKEEEEEEALAHRRKLHRDHTIAAVKQLVEAYDSCVANLRDFRTSHMNLVAEYIMAQQQKRTPRPTGSNTTSTTTSTSSSSSSSATVATNTSSESSINNVNASKPKKQALENSAGGKGTGGTDLMNFLKPIRDDCKASLLVAPPPPTTTGTPSVSKLAGNPIANTATVATVGTTKSLAVDSTGSKAAGAATTATMPAGTHPSSTAASAGTTEIGTTLMSSAFTDIAIAAQQQQKEADIVPVMLPVSQQESLADSCEPYIKDNGCCDDIDLYRGACAKPKSSSTTGSRDVVQRQESPSIESREDLDLFRGGAAAGQRQDSNSSGGISTASSTSNMDASVQPLALPVAMEMGPGRILRSVSSSSNDALYALSTSPGLTGGSGRGGAVGASSKQQQQEGPLEMGWEMPFNYAPFVTAAASAQISSYPSRLSIDGDDMVLESCHTYQ
eukprot:CAMPEP_0175007498 /NCGR_PEP_ID=MMETSP0005-20121125/6443_1 /TAXON_ID=420556 /ORGANISM="Ochromonas sp., Strain CCMP1393" /LENGTH=1042 /DNA_ID=CAMNT_0016262943 /DNA_START=38 /DNA_END=3166 /DNA_ORIENTATION=+